MQECKANIYVVGHKLFSMPTEDELYVPLMVGNKYGDCPQNYCRDCDGESISELNPSFNELTGTYWVWKNAEAQILGICHYRRYFTSPLGKVRNLLFHTLPSPITYRYIEKQLQKYDVIVHNKTYFKSTNREQLLQDPGKSASQNSSKLSLEVLKLAEDCFHTVYPQDWDVYKQVMDSHTGHLLNMLICKRDMFQPYCEWIFPVLFMFEKKLTELKYDKSRAVGLFAERLLDVWIKKNQLNIKECFSFNTERIDWKVW